MTPAPRLQPDQTDRSVGSRSATQTSYRIPLYFPRLIPVLAVVQTMSKQHRRHSQQDPATGETPKRPAKHRIPWQNRDRKAYHPRTALDCYELQEFRPTFKLQSRTRIEMTSRRPTRARVLHASLWLVVIAAGIRHAEASCGSYVRSRHDVENTTVSPTSRRPMPDGHVRYEPHSLTPGPRADWPSSQQPCSGPSCRSGVPSSAPIQNVPQRLVPEKPVSCDVSERPLASTPCSSGLRLSCGLQLSRGFPLPVEQPPQRNI
jgi:hypothetical protein